MKHWILSQPIHLKFYLAGFFASSMALPFSLCVSLASSAWLIIGAISPILLSIGFVIWIYPVLKWVLQSNFSKTAFALFNIIVIAVATIHSRNAVSAALGLPSTDFELTVSIVLALSYPIALLAFLSLASPFVSLGLLLLCLLPARLTNKIRIIRAQVADNAVGSFGALGTGFFAFIFIVGLSSQPAATKELIKRVAYYADYQYGGMYPGILKNTRYRLHENGIVSYAIINNGSTNIFIGKVLLPDERNAVADCPEQRSSR